MLKIFTVAVTPLQQNCRILACMESKEAAVVDPGGDVPMILELLAQKELHCSQIWLTHSHFDHCGGVAALKKESQANLLAHGLEKEFRARASEISAMFGVEPGHFDDCPEPDQYLTGGEVLSVGTFDFNVLFTPGHSPGHLCYYCEQIGKVLTGDLLFAGSVGRTDLPGGSQHQLIDSIRKKLLVLPPETGVLAGHGPDTTIKVEMEHNPFISEE